MVMEQKFEYLIYRQNNSGGKFLLSFDIGQRVIWSFPKGTPNSVLIERYNEIAFDMYNYNRSDCPCCGSRWNNPQRINVLSEEEIKAHCHQEYTVHHHYSGNAWSRERWNIPQDDEGMMSVEDVKRQIFNGTLRNNPDLDDEIVDWRPIPLDYDD